MRSYSPIALLILIAIILGGCASSNKFAASFGKRKYMKGYYMDKPSGTEAVSAKEPGKASNSLIKPFIGTKQTVQTENLNKPKETRIVATKLQRAIMAVSLPKPAIQDKPAEKYIRTVNGDDYRHTGVVQHKRISGGLLFAIIFLSAIAGLIILAVIIVSVSLAAKALLLVLSLILLIVAIAMLITVATNSNIPGDVAGPVIEVLIDAFFAIISGIH